MLGKQADPRTERERQSLRRFDLERTFRQPSSQALEHGFQAMDLRRRNHHEQFVRAMAS